MSSVRTLMSLALALSSCESVPPPYVPSASDRRLLLEASAIAVLSEERGGESLPTVVLLGGTREPELLLVRFEPRALGPGSVRAAYLRLSPREGSPARQPTTLHSSRIGAPWHAGELNWGNRPSLGPPYAEASAPPNGDVRIDVTALVRSAQAHPDEDYGIAVSGERDQDSESSYATGASGGHGPELEIFVR